MINLSILIRVKGFEVFKKLKFIRYTLKTVKTLKKENILHFAYKKYFN